MKLDLTRITLDKKIYLFKDFKAINISLKAWEKGGDVREKLMVCSYFYLFVFCDDLDDLNNVRTHLPIYIIVEGYL